MRAAHRAGLSVGQKNLAGLDGTRIGFDFAVAEECGRYRECRRYLAAYGDQVLAIEYRARDFAADLPPGGAADPGRAARPRPEPRRGAPLVLTLAEDRGSQRSAAWRAR